MWSVWPAFLFIYIIQYILKALDVLPITTYFRKLTISIFVSSQLAMGRIMVQKDTVSGEAQAHWAQHKVHTNVGCMQTTHVHKVSGQKECLPHGDKLDNKTGKPKHLRVISGTYRNSSGSRPFGFLQIKMFRVVVFILSAYLSCFCIVYYIECVTVNKVWVENFFWFITLLQITWQTELLREGVYYVDPWM